MTRAIAVLRPEPGNAATAARITLGGGTVIRLPLFRIVAVDWAVADPADHDALLLTSANAVRCGGDGLCALLHLPVLAVGAATAAAARAAGFRVAMTGDGDAAALIDSAAGFGRILHLAGRDRIPTGATSLTVYASDTVPTLTGSIRALAGCVVLLHSARAARRFVALADAAGLDRANVRIAAISAVVAAAAGDGWDRIVASPRPADAALVPLAHTLAD